MMVGLTKSMGSLMDMMKTIEGETPASAAKILAAGGAMVLLAGAILLLSVAVKNIASLSWEEMARGLIGTGALIAALAVSYTHLDVYKRQIISSVVTTLFNLFGIAQNGAGGFLALTAAVGDFIVRIQDWLTTNGKICLLYTSRCV